MSAGRTLLLAVDGLTAAEAAASPLGAGASALRLLPDGPSEPTPALTSLLTGTSAERTGITTEIPLLPEQPETRSPWEARSLRLPTLFAQARRAGLVTAALHWPATAGAPIDLCLPPDEDGGRFRRRWETAERTSSPRMVAEHLAPRRAAGVRLSQVPADDLVAGIAADALAGARIDLLAARLTGLGAVRRRDGPASPQALRALQDTAASLTTILEAFAATEEDRVLLLPGRPLVATTLLVHPNAALTGPGLVRTRGTHLTDFRALVWPDGPRALVHARRSEGSALRALALDSLAGIAAHSRLRLRRVEEGDGGGAGASAQTDVIGVLEGTAGTVFGLSATHRPLVAGDDPYCAGPRAVSDPSAAVTALGRGPGLPVGTAEGSWADLGVTLAAAMGLELPGATATGLRARGPTASGPAASDSPASGPAASRPLAPSSAPRR
ncbi:alkaline phosphatase family protein [Brachybacterium sp. AOP43-C2-M15]|uniref:alkaline phosphatase family protein n=1 Tax=Brachybacterium sp. AOP43-C2-M15 TaxID=3457661 RepID=UPI004034C647